MKKILNKDDQLIIEQNKNKALTFQLNKALAYIEYLAMMQNTSLTEEEQEVISND